MRALLDDPITAAKTAAHKTVTTQVRGTPMSYTERGPVVLGLCILVALGLLAFSAAAAQAEGQWTIKGKALTSTETISGSAEGTSTFLVPSIKLQIACGEASVSGKLEVEGKGNQTMTFGKCVVVGAPSCKVDPIVAQFKNQLVLHGGETWIVFLPPVEGKPFTTIFILECAFQEVNQLTGSFIALLGSEAVEQLLAFKSDSATAELFKPLGIKIGYAFGAAPAFLDMSSIWKLSGANAGQNWGAI